MRRAVSAVARICLEPGRLRFPRVSSSFIRSAGTTAILLLPLSAGLIRGDVYRTLVEWYGYEHLNWGGGELVKAELHFSANQGRKQTLSILRRDSESSDVIEGPATLLANLDNWVWGQNLVIDVTPTVKAWDKDLTSMHGFIVRGGNESFTHDNANGICLISSPQLVITRSVKK